MNKETQIVNKSLMATILLSIAIYSHADRTCTREEPIIMEAPDTLPDKYTKIGRDTAIEKQIPFKECVKKTRKVLREVSVGGWRTKEATDSGHSDISDTSFKKYEAKAWTNTGRVTVLCRSTDDEPDSMTIRRDPYE